MSSEERLSDFDKLLAKCREQSKEADDLIKRMNENIKLVNMELALHKSLNAYQDAILEAMENPK